MRLTAICTVLFLAAVQGGEVEAGLRTARERLRGQAIQQRQLSGLQRRAALASGMLAEPGDSRERLLTVDRMLQADFAAIDAKLSGLDLPEKVSAWREFVSHYRARLAAGDAAAQGEARRHETVRRMSARRVPTGRRAEADLPQVSADEGPAPGDLAESKVVLLTPEIRAKAAALGGDATALYNWVGQNIEYFPALGQMQNSQAVMASGRGNDFDEATLLIALLRASGIPARFASGDVVMPREDVREWMGVKDETLILSLLSQFEDFQLFPTVEKDRVVATRVWVEAWVEVDGEKRWMVMDPARKRRSFQPGIVLPRPVYDRMEYLRAQRPVPPGEAYLDALRADFYRRYPGQGFNEVAYTGALRTPMPAAREPHYPVVKMRFRGSETPGIRQHRIRLTLSPYGGATAYVSVDLVLPEVVLQSITLQFNPATAADAKVAAAFGGLEKTPAVLANVAPEFRLGEQVLATGRIPIAMGTILDLAVTHLPPVQDTTPYVNVNHHMFKAGETAAMVLGAHLVTDEVLTARISSFLDRLPSASTAEATRRLLDIAAMRYLHRVEMDEKRVADPLQMQFYPDDEVGNAITFATLDTQNLFDRPFVVTPGRLQIHAWPTCLPYVDLNSNDSNAPVTKTAWQLHNDAISALEHEIWEELVMIPTVSTIKVLQAAVKANVPIRTITQANAAAELQAMEAPGEVKMALLEVLADGATVTIPQKPMTIGTWRGAAWIEEYPNWDYNYIIFDFTFLSPGGDTGGTAPPPRPPQQDPGVVGTPAPTNNTTCTDPVNVANGNLFEQVADYGLTTRGPSIVFERTYNSLALVDGPLGPGWRHRYQVTLKDNGNSVMVQEGSGLTLTFAQRGAAYVSPAGYQLTLTKDAQGYVLRTKKGMESRFDSQGVLQSMADRNQNAIQFRYEGDRLLQVTDRSGRGITLNYDGRGRVTGLEDFTGRRVSYEYDSAGHLAGVTNAGGNRTTYAYYTDRFFNHLLKSVTTPEGSATSFEYYGNGKVARVILAGGQDTKFLYLPMRNETHVIDAHGLLTSYQFNSMGTVARIVRPDGSYIDRVYNPEAKLESQTDAAGYTTRYAYDGSANLTEVTDPLGRVMRFAYDPKFNLLASVTDAAGNVTRFEYDARGNLTRSVRPMEGETRFTWDGFGNLTSRTDAEGGSVTYSYDEFGNPVSVRDAMGNVTRAQFDRLNRMTRTEDALGGGGRFEYDAMDQVVRQMDRLGRSSSMVYDREGRLAKSTDAAGRTTAFGYDALSHLTQVTDAMEQVTEYGYATPECGCAASANLVRVRDAAGRVGTQEYDFLDRLISSGDALGNRTGFGYDAQGNLAWKTDASGGVTRFEHDGARRLTRKVSPEGAEARFAYDFNNNLVSASNEHVTYTFTYDARNRLVTSRESRFGKVLTYAYDRLGRRTSMTDSEGGVFSYSWDAGRRLTSVGNPAGATATFGYDALGRNTRVTFSNGVASEREYDEGGRLSSLTHGRMARFAYRYDAADNAAAVTDNSGARSYEYDRADRLVTGTHPVLGVESFRYDGAGNRLAAARGTEYAYDAVGRLLAAEGGTYQYDKNGNVVERSTPEGTTKYTWDGANQLVRIDLADGGYATYKYDPFGRRIEKDVNGTVTAYVYDLSSILLEVDAAGAVQARYTHATGVDQPLMMERGGQLYFYHLDGESNVAQLSDAGGGVVCSYSYESFGRTKVCDQVVNPYAFAGREFDPESGLYYMRARYYDPGLGRFLSPDPLDVANVVLATQDARAARTVLPASAAALTGTAGLEALRQPQQFNAYGYARNNPLSFRDPSGLKCRIQVMIGTVPDGSGATSEEWAWQGFMTKEKFDHWLTQNHLHISYTEGGYAAIVDPSGNVLGAAPVWQLGITRVEYPYKSTWQQLREDLADLGNSLKAQFQASFRVPWHKLNGAQYWDAANNPEAYVEP